MLRCPECGDEYKKEGWFTKHLRNEHNWDDDKIERLLNDELCPYCGEVLLNPENPAGCTYCGKWLGPPRIMRIYKELKNK